MIQERNFAHMDSTIQIEIDDNQIHVTLLLCDETVLDSNHLACVLLVELCRLYQIIYYTKNTKYNLPKITSKNQYQLYEDTTIRDLNIKKIKDNFKKEKNLLYDTLINSFKKKKHELEIQKQVIDQIENQGQEEFQHKSKDPQEYYRKNNRLKQNNNNKEYKTYNDRSPQELLDLLKHFLTINELKIWLNMPRTFLKEELTLLDINHDRIQNIIENVERLPKYTKAEIHQMNQIVHDRYMKKQKL